MIAACIILIVMTSATSSIGNSMLKAGATRAGGEQPLSARNVPRTLMQPAVLAGVLIYAISQLLWITALRLMDLSLAYPLQIGLNFTMIMLIAWSYFHEPLSPLKLFGIGLIFGGMLLIALD